MGISEVCDTTYTAKHNSGKRPLSLIRWVVMHDTEGGTARTIAAYFQRAPSPDTGSTHLVIDDVSCYRTLADDVVPWAAPGANTSGFHIEQVGYAKWSNLIWSSRHRATLDRAAYKAALHCRKFGLPPTFIDSDGLKAGRPGVTTHAECTKAFGGSHTDPGAGWPRLWFMRRVRYWHKRLWHVKPVG